MHVLENFCLLALELQVVGPFLHLLDHHTGGRASIPSTSIDPSSRSLAYTLDFTCRWFLTLLLGSQYWSNLASSNCNWLKSSITDRKVAAIGVSCKWVLHPHWPHGKWDRESAMYFLFLSIGWPGHMTRPRVLPHLQHVCLSSLLCVTSLGNLSGLLVFPRSFWLSSSLSTSSSSLYYGG